MIGKLRIFWPCLAAALVALSVSTLLGLVPLYGTKIVFDSVLRDHPFPARLPYGITLPQDRRQLLTFVTIGMVVLAAGSELSIMPQRSK